jgi:hypothetical protein
MYDTSIYLGIKGIDFIINSDKNTYEDKREWY